MVDKETDAKRELIQILDQVLAEGIWKGSLFLEAAGKRIQDLRTRLVTDFQLEDEMTAAAIKEPLSQYTIPANYTLVYVAVYQAAGANIKKWEVLLNSLENYLSGRPIYKNEADVKAFIRAKENQQNDGYIEVAVETKDILNAAASKPLLDRAGRELLMVKDHAIKSNNILRFMHISGEYLFKDGLLVKK